MAYYTPVRLQGPCGEEVKVTHGVFFHEKTVTGLRRCPNVTTMSDWASPACGSLLTIFHPTTRKEKETESRNKRRSTDARSETSFYPQKRGSFGAAPNWMTPVEDTWEKPRKVKRVENPGRARHRSLC